MDRTSSAFALSAQGPPGETGGATYLSLELRGPDGRDAARARYRRREVLSGRFARTAKRARGRAAWSAPRRLVLEARADTSARGTQEEVRTQAGLLRVA